jgi:hypothetical protein
MTSGREENIHLWTTGSPNPQRSELLRLKDEMFCFRKISSLAFATTLMVRLDGLIGGLAECRFQKFIKPAS